jgi:transcription termination factor Rho
MTNNDHTEPMPPAPAATKQAAASSRKTAGATTITKTTAKKITAKKITAKKITAKKITAKKITAKKITAEKTTAEKTTAEKTTAEKTTAKKTTAKKTTAKKTVRKATEAISRNAAVADTPNLSGTVTAVASPTPTAVPELPPVIVSEPGHAVRRLGRVPGGGALQPRDFDKAPKANSNKDAYDASPAARDVPAPIQTPATVQTTPDSTASPAPPVIQTPQKQPHQAHAANHESRSKRRREKRKQHRNQGQNRHHGSQRQAQSNSDTNLSRLDPEANRPIILTGPRIDTNGLLELAPKGFGFLRVSKKNFEQARDDVFVPPEMIRRHNLRIGQWLHGVYQDGSRGPQLVELTQINGLPPEEAGKLPHFDELKAINPTKRLSFETSPERFTTRVIDIMTPVGRGQRGLIVSPPRSGKTTMLLHTAEAVRDKYSDSLHLMILLVDERPEEVTEFRRALPGAEIYASSNDEVARNHCRIAELAIERAKRLVEAGKDVFLLMDSITRLARAYNATMNNVGRGTGSGGITIGALEVPRRLFAAARNTRGGGSLTILATALIQTNSRADEAIFLEFKGTGNMELVLDRKIAENYIYPAVDIFKSGTRREELLLPEHMLHKIHLIRRGLAGHRPLEAMERLLFFLKKFPNNPQMLLEIKG